MTVIPLLLLVAAQVAPSPAPPPARPVPGSAAQALPAGPPPPVSAAARYERCVDLATTAPQQGVAEAGAWRIAGGGFLARQCEGLAYARLAQWPAAATAFTTAARDAETAGDARAANYWAQAGNAHLANGKAAEARAALDAALAKPTLIGPARGEAHLDRARALVAGGDVAGARGDLDRATQLVPQDPLAWLLSATQARRGGAIPRAQADIAEALKLSPDDAQVRLEAGNIAALVGNEADARAHWTAAATVQPGSPAAASARAALAQFAQ